MTAFSPRVTKESIIDQTSFSENLPPPLFAYLYGREKIAKEGLFLPLVSFSCP